VILKIVFGMVHGWKKKYKSQILKSSFRKFGYLLELNIELGNFLFFENDHWVLKPQKFNILVILKKRIIKE
jgi:hypothetical protein